MLQDLEKDASTPKREPFHFHFPDGSAVWVEVEQGPDGQWNICVENRKLLAEMLAAIMDRQKKTEGSA